MKLNLSNGTTTPVLETIDDLTAILVCSSKESLLGRRPRKTVLMAEVKEVGMEEQTVYIFGNAGPSGFVSVRVPKALPKSCMKDRHHPTNGARLKMSAVPHYDNPKYDNPKATDYVYRFDEHVLFFEIGRPA